MCTCYAHHYRGDDGHNGFVFGHLEEKLSRLLAPCLLATERKGEREGGRGEERVRSGRDREKCRVTHAASWLEVGQATPHCLCRKGHVVGLRFS